MTFLAGHFWWFMGGVMGLILLLLVVTWIEHVLYLRRARRFEVDERSPRPDAVADPVVDESEIEDVEVTES